MAKLLCICLCLVDAIVELHAMDEKLFNDFFHWKVKVEIIFSLFNNIYCISYLMKEYLIHDGFLIYAVQVFITVN